MPSVKKFNRFNVFINKFTADDKYFRYNRENLLLPLLMELSQKPKIFCCFFIAFLESTLNFEHFQKGGRPHSLSISEIIDSEQ